MTLHEPNRPNPAPLEVYQKPDRVGNTFTHHIVRERALDD